MLVVGAIKATEFQEKGYEMFVYFRTTTKVTKIKKSDVSEAINNCSCVVEVPKRKFAEETKQVMFEACYFDPFIL